MIKNINSVILGLCLTACVGTLDSGPAGPLPRDPVPPDGSVPDVPSNPECEPEYVGSLSPEELEELLSGSNYSENMYDAPDPLWACLEQNTFWCPVQPHAVPNIRSELHNYHERFRESFLQNPVGRQCQNDLAHYKTIGCFVPWYRLTLCLRHETLTRVEGGLSCEDVESQKCLDLEEELDECVSMCSPPETPEIPDVILI